MFPPFDTEAEEKTTQNNKATLEGKSFSSRRADCMHVCMYVCMYV